MESNLRLFLDILRQDGITPTFPITAKALGTHPDLIRKFSDAGVEFAIHGYNHIDYTQLTPEELSEQIDKAVKIFQEHNIPFSGFRSPYLRWDKKSLNVIDSPFFKWDSSYTILWDVLKNIRIKEKNWRNYQTVLSQYQYRNSDSYVSLPRFRNNILEIPVSLPDDDLLFDRFGVKEEKILTQIWGEILKQTHSRGELFTLQLHPERISFYKETLKSLIRTANNSNPKIWLTSLGDIAEWWNEKKGFSIVINKKRNNEFEIHAHCSERATVLLKTKDAKNAKFFNEYSVINTKNFTLRSSKRPIIGISKNCSPMLIKFLKNEGFIFEISSEENNYSVFLNDLEVLNEEDEIGVLEKIDRAHLPLIRFWRWPNGCRSVLAVTGDIDGLTSLDFFSRFFCR